MQKLTNKMLLTGHRDYPEVCEKIMQLLEKGAKDMGMSW